MNTTQKMLKGIAILAATAAALPMTAQATEWEAGKVEIVIPHSTSGSQNRTTRVLGEHWSQQLDTRFSYNNKKGGSGRIGYDFFMSKRANGKYIMSSNVASAAIMYAQQKPRWEWEESLVSVGVFAIDPGAFFVKADSPYQTLEDVIEASKENRRTLSLAYWASPDNMLVHQIMDQTGAQIQVVPSGGAGNSITSVIAGNVEFGFTKLASVLKSGDELRILAISQPTNKVKEATNNAPTVDEALGTKTLPVASYRTVNVHKKFAVEHPEQFALLQQTFEATKDDPEFIAAMQKAKVDKSLIVDMNGEEIDGIIADHIAAYAQYGELLDK